jgi:UDP-N-acetylmuramate dehydrogenase
MSSPRSAESLAEQVSRALAVLGSRAIAEAPLGALTTYRVGGPAAVRFEADDERQLAAVAAARAETGLPVLVVGKGSNLLVADAGFPGIAVILGAGFTEIGMAPSEVTAGAAVSLPVLSRRTAAVGLRGLEWMVGVPGTVGGAVRMNAGGHGSDMAGCLRCCRVVDLRTGEAEEWPVDRLAFGYRHSAIEDHHVVVEAVIAGRRGDRAAAEAEIAEIVRWRREHQPGGQNAGSVFTNPPDAPAGALVEAAGCKGWRRGTATVSPKHANFIQCDEGGSADDVLALIAAVTDEVDRRLGVRLATEIRLVGFPGTYPHAVADAGAGGE